VTEQMEEASAVLTEKDNWLAQDLFRQTRR
jgi:hypothetical protein